MTARTVDRSDIASRVIIHFLSCDVVIFYLPDSHQSTTVGICTGASPFLRAFNAATGDHFYTLNQIEYANGLACEVYPAENVSCNIFASQVPNSVPFYRMFNFIVQDHFYTISLAERDNAIANLGYDDQGVAGFVFSNVPDGCDP